MVRFQERPSLFSISTEESSESRSKNKNEKLIDLSKKGISFGLEKGKNKVIETCAARNLPLTQKFKESLEINTSNLGSFLFDFLQDYFFGKSNSKEEFLKMLLITKL